MKLSGIVAEWLDKEYGGKYSYQTTIVPVDTSAAFVIPNNPERTFLLFINTSVNSIYLMPEALPTAPTGLTLAPSGGFLGFTLWDDLVMPSLQYGAVASGAASDLLIIEVLRYAKAAPQEV